MPFFIAPLSEKGKLKQRVAGQYLLEERKMKNSRLVLAVAIVTAFFQAAVLGLDKDFTADGTINPGEVWDNVTIADTPPDSTVVGMSSGQVTNLNIGTYSTLNIDWGFISNLTADDTSSVNIYDAIVGQFCADGSSRINLYGGDFQNVSINENSRLRFNDGFIQDLIINTNRATYISGGQIDHLYSYYSGYGSSPVFNISGGTVNAIQADGIFNISGGILSASDAYGTFNISGGAVWGLSGRGDMVINVTGGYIGNSVVMGGNSTLNIDTTPSYESMDISCSEQSRINIRGGEYDYVTISDSSKLDFSNGYIRELYVNHDNWEYVPQATYISGGKIDSIRSYGGGYGEVFNISGGQVNLNGWGDSYESVCRGSNIFNISGGDVGGLVGRDNMTINVTGGNVGDRLEMDGHSVLNISHSNPYWSSSLSGRGNSTLNVTGGEFVTVSLGDNSSLKFSNGYIRELNISHNDGPQATYISGGKIDNISSSGSDCEIFNISGGQVMLMSWGEGSSACQGNNIFNITGGGVSGIVGRDNMIVNVTGGNIGSYISMEDNSILNIDISSFFGSMGISGSNQSRINIEGGEYDRVLLADKSLLQLRNGMVGTIAVSGSGYAVLEGGTVNELLLSDMAAAELYEGLVVNHIMAEGDSIVKIYGYNFTYDASGGSFGGGQLLGFWLDGRAFELELMNAQGDSTFYNHIELVPEPATLLLLGLGVIALRRGQRKCSA